MQENTIFNNVKRNTSVFLSLIYQYIYIITIIFKRDITQFTIKSGDGQDFFHESKRFYLVWTFCQQSFNEDGTYIFKFTCVRVSYVLRATGLSSRNNMDVIWTYIL